MDNTGKDGQNRFRSTPSSTESSASFAVYFFSCVHIHLSVLTAVCSQFVNALMLEDVNFQLLLLPVEFLLFIQLFECLVFLSSIHLFQSGFSVPLCSSTVIVCPVLISLTWCLFTCPLYLNLASPLSSLYSLCFYHFQFW